MRRAAGQCGRSVLQNLLTFQDHIAGRLADDVAGGLDADILALDRRPAILLHDDRRAAAPQCEVIARFNRDVLFGPSRRGLGRLPRGRFDC